MFSVIAYIPVLILAFHGVASRDHDNFAHKLLMDNLPRCDQNATSGPPPDIEPFVVGGNATRPKEFPWIINIRTVDTSGDIIFKCGGSIIDQKTVLTAAHCLFSRDTRQPLPPEKIVVVAGDYNISCSEGVEQVVYAQAIIVHEQFNWHDKVNDIALIRLKHKLRLTDAVQSISVPNFDLIGRSETGVVAGWGSDGSKEISDVLLKAELPILSGKECKIKQRRFQICAGGNGSDTCQGDSGGPLMCNHKNQLYLCGIVSGGPDETCGGYMPGIFMNAYGYKKWIDNNRSFSPPKLAITIVVGIVGFVTLAVITMAVAFNHTFKRNEYRRADLLASNPSID